MFDRRNFLRFSMAAAGGAFCLPMDAIGRAGKQFVDWKPERDGERRRLTSLAEFGRKHPVKGKNGVVVTTHPLASRAAVDVLKDGGNACDAAIAAAVTQTVVEPHMTTITGCFSMLHYEAENGRYSYVNGNVNAPLAPLPGFSRSDLDTGRAAAVPGYWGGLQAAWERHGTIALKRLLAPAVHYARHGFEIHPFLWGEMFSQQHVLGRYEEGQEIYMPSKVLPTIGEKIYQKRAADTLERLSEEGSKYFYHGEFAQKFSKKVQEAGGVITPDDFARYEARWQEPARGTYKGYDIIASPPPDNGGTHLIEILNMIEILRGSGYGHYLESPEMTYQMMMIIYSVFVEGAKQRDPLSYPVPLETILSKEYAEMRLSLLQMSNPLLEKNDTPSAVPPGSNHLTVIDKKGNVATVLHSCMSWPWQNGLFVEGISICAAGTHFLRVMPKPGDRVSAYVCPNIFAKAGKPVLASGSPSVSLLQNIVLNSLNILEHNIPIADSVQLPRFGGASFRHPGSLMIESDMGEALIGEVAKRGVKLEVVNPWNWNHGSFEGIHIKGDGTAEACGDPRRTAMALGVAG